MKTSILLSSIAALSLLITFAESPNRFSADNNKSSLNSSFIYIPSNLIYSAPVEKISSNETEYTEVKSNEKLFKSFDYLKFDVNQYAKKDKLTSFDALELPVSKFDYLKFDVNNFIENNELNLSEITELPVDECSNLKFDINKYAAQNTNDTNNLGEMPANE